MSVVFWGIELSILEVYLLAINLVSFLFFVYDKRQATVNGQRIRERTLLVLTLLGGSVGALLGMKYARHKTKKVSFQLWMFLIVLFQLMGVVYLSQEGYIF